MSDTPTTPNPDATSPSDADTSNDDVFDQAAEFTPGWADKIRREGQKYRDEARAAKEQLATYESVYGAYEPEDRAVWLDIARSWATDPRQAAAIMQQIATAVLGEDDGGLPGNDDDTDDVDVSDSPLTQEQVAELVRQQVDASNYEREQDRMVDAIYDSMRKAGIEPRSRDGIAVLWTANNETEGDIDKAIKMFEADRQKAVDQYVSDRASGKRPALAPTNGVPASAQTPIANLDDARKAADAFLRAQSGSS